MLLGTYDHNMDDKGRVAIPARIRQTLRAPYVATEGLEKCVYVFSCDEWERFYRKFADLPITNRDGRDLARSFLAKATECEPDRQGRILIPAILREYARLSGDVKVLGVGGRLEIWDPLELQERYEATGSDEGREERLAALGV